MHAHLARLHLALRVEQAAQLAQHAALLAAPLAERVASGVCWAPIRVEPDGDDLIVRPAKNATLHDELGPGDQVTLDPPGAPGTGPRARVLAAEARYALLRPERDADIPEGCVVTLAFDSSTFIRQRQALERAEASPNPLRALLLGEVVPGLAGTYRGPSVISPELDASQHAALHHCINQRHLAAVHGPPGTGKTQTLVALLVALVAEGDRPWALAESNAAVDHLCLRAAARGLEVLRLGPPHRLSPAVAPYTLDAWVARGPHAQAISSAEKELSRARSRRADPRTVALLRRQRDAVQDQAEREAMRSADVLCATLGTLARLAPDMPPARTAIVDEASQAVEPAIWAAVPHVERLVLFGDPHQLGPVVVGPPEPLGRSLLQRLLDEGTLTMPMLATQRRMNLTLQALIQPIYGEAYQAHPTVADHQLTDLPGITLQDAPPFTLIDMSGFGDGERKDPRSGSTYNPDELQIAAQQVQAWREAGLRPDQIGVITPYRAQRDRLRALPELEGVEVDTVNGFQGREKEAILVSLVRSNANNDLGFVADERRLTVSLSRARRALVVIGDLSTLAAWPRLDALASHATETGALRSAWEL